LQTRGPRKDVGVPTISTKLPFVRDRRQTLSRERTGERRYSAFGLKVKL